MTTKTVEDLIVEEHARRGMNPCINDEGLHNV